MILLEQKLQEQYVFWLYSKGLLYCASAGGLHTTNRKAAIRMKRAGYIAGYPDVAIFEPHGKWHGMMVELKVGSYPSPEQKKWQVELTKRGYYAVIVPGKLDFWRASEWLIEQTEKYLKGEA